MCIHMYNAEQIPRLKAHFMGCKLPTPGPGNYQACLSNVLALKIHEHLCMF